MLVYLEDTLVARHSKVQHSSHACPLFGRLYKHGIMGKTWKCVLGKPGVTLLGHTVSFSDMASLTDSVTSIRDYLEPRSYGQLQQFAVLVNFYQLFVSNCAEIITLFAYLLR